MTRTCTRCTAIAARSTCSGAARPTRASTPRLARVPCRRPPRHRPFPAHAPPRLRPRSARCADCCRTCRSSTRSTSTCRSATTAARWCARTTLELCTHASPARCHQCFPEPRRRSSSSASGSSRRSSTSSTCSSRRASSCASATSSGASRREDPARGLRAPAGRADPGAAPSRAAAQPHRLLRPVHALQGRGRAARGDEDADQERGTDVELWLHGANLEIQPTPRSRRGIADLLLEDRRERDVPAARYAARRSCRT